MNWTVRPQSGYVSSNEDKSQNVWMEQVRTSLRTYGWSSSGQVSERMEGAGQDKSQNVWKEQVRTSRRTYVNSRSGQWKEQVRTSLRTYVNSRSGQVSELM